VGDEGGSTKKGKPKAKARKNRRVWEQVNREKVVQSQNIISDIIKRRKPGRTKEKRYG